MWFRIQLHKGWSSFLRSLLCILTLLLFLNHFVRNFDWGYQIFGCNGGLSTNEQAWQETKHGDLAAYSELLREQLFIRQDPDQILFVPDRKKTQVPFANKFWLGVTPLYIFPSKVIVSDNYDFVIPDEKMPFLNSLNNITYIYGNRRFHLLSNLTQKEYKKWALFVHAADGVVDVFTLPLNYISKLGD